MMNRSIATQAAGAGLAEGFDAPPTSVLTGGEVAFAIAAGVPADLFNDDTGLHRAVRDAQDTTPNEPKLTTDQVAERLNCTPASVRRMLGRGELFAAGRIGRQTAYPAWQFTSSGALPHLRQVIAALPSGYHPRDVLTVMTSPLTELNGRSPKAWLEAGGEPAALLELLQELTL